MSSAAKVFALLKTGIFTVFVPGVVARSSSYDCCIR
jgi:hypothetical protein